jgi:hypothetical protein
VQLMSCSQIRTNSQFCQNHLRIGTYQFLLKLNQNWGYCSRTKYLEQDGLPILIYIGETLHWNKFWIGWSSCCSSNAGELQTHWRLPHIKDIYRLLHIQMGSSRLSTPAASTRRVLCLQVSLFPTEFWVLIVSNTLSLLSFVVAITSTSGSSCSYHHALALLT